MAFKGRQNQFSAGALHWTPVGELTMLPRPIVGWRGDTPPRTPPHSVPTHLRRSPRVPQNSSQIYAYGEGEAREWGERESGVGEEMLKQ